MTNIIFEIVREIFFQTFIAVLLKIDKMSMKKIVGVVVLVLFSLLGCSRTSQFGELWSKNR